MTGRRGHQAEVLRSLGLVAQLPEAASELGGGPKRGGSVTPNKARDGRVIDTRLLRQLALRHLLRLELGPQPIVEGPSVMDAHRITWCVVRRGHSRMIRCA